MHFKSLTETEQRLLLKTTGCNEDSDPQGVILPDSLRAKLDKFHGWKGSANHSVAPEAPLFMSRRKRRVAYGAADRLLDPFDPVSPYARSSAYSAVRPAQVSFLTTSIYAHPNDDELMRSIRDLSC